MEEQSDQTPPAEQSKPIETQATDSTVETQTPETFIIRRNPIGIILVYLETLGALIALVAFAWIVFPGMFKNISNSDLALMTVAGLVVAVGTVFMLGVATYIYNRNRIIVTDHDVEQTIQKGLLFCKNSRLELSDVEDVAVAQSGLLPTLFNYGVLTIETAGAEDNFIFPYCRNPNIHAKRILEARGRYIAHSHLLHAAD